MGNSKHFVFILLLCFSFFMGKSQINGVDQILGSTETYNTAVPFLTQSKDARSSGMGDCGVSTSTYLNSIFFNPAKIAFAEKKNGESITYTPWLRSSALELLSISRMPLVGKPSTNYILYNCSMVLSGFQFQGSRSSILLTVLAGSLSSTSAR